MPYRMCISPTVNGMSEQLHFPPGQGCVHLEGAQARLAGSGLGVAWDLFSWQAPPGMPSSMAWPPPRGRQGHRRGPLDRGRQVLMMAALLTGIPSRQLQLTDLGSPRPGPAEALVAVGRAGYAVLTSTLWRASPTGLSYLSSSVTSLWGPFWRALAPPRTGPELGSCPPFSLAVAYVRRAAATVRRGSVLRPTHRGGPSGRPGGFAAQVVLPYRHLLRVPEAMPDEAAAALVDAGTTAGNAACLAMQARSYGDPRYLVLGGARGLLVSEVLRAKGQRTVVVEPNQARRGNFWPGGSPRASLPLAPDKFTSVIDCVGAPYQFAPGVELLQPRGRYLCVGYSAVPDIDLAHLARSPA